MAAAADPDLALRLAKTVADIYGQATADLLQLVARRLARGIDTPGWAEEKLAEVARLRTDAQQIVERLAVAGPDAITAAIAQGYGTGNLPISEALRDRPLNAITRETIGSVTATHLRVLRSTEDAFRAVVAETAPQTIIGAQTRRQATQRALDRFADRGITGFVDSAGRRWEMDTYAEMATRTAVGRAQVAGSLDRMSSDGRDLVIVSDAPQECKKCRPWEGKVLSITGATPGYPTVAEAQADGLLHANCRHRLGAYIPGVTKRLTDTADPEGDAARQEQRRLERGVRQWKRREAVALDDDTARAAAVHRKAWEDRLAKHVKDNDLKRLRYRESIQNGTTGPTGMRPTRPTRPAPTPSAAPPAGTRRASDSIANMPGPRSKTGAGARSGLDAIEKVHQVPDGLPRVSVRRSASQRFYGRYSWSNDGTPAGIDLSQHGDHVPATLAHEFGHYLDHQIDGPSSWLSRSPEAQAWRDAVEATDTIRQLRAGPRNRDQLYFLDQREIWARSYAQWIAVRSGDAEMLQQLLEIRSGALTAERRLSQWDPEEFVPIVEAFDDLFRQKGLIE